MRTSIGLVAVVVALAASLGSAAAQYYPPPPSAYLPPPPAAYPPPPPGSYSQAPLPPPDDGAAYGQGQTGYGQAAYGQGQNVYRDASSAPYDPRMASGQGGGYGYPPPDQPYGGRYAPQPMPSVGGDPIMRPPANVAAAPDSADVTGTVRTPRDAASADRGTAVAAVPPDDPSIQGMSQELPPRFRRQLVNYTTSEPAGTIIIDTPNTYLYLVRGNGKALRYGIGVGREGFTWSGGERIARMAEWPDWHPPKEMIERQPYLPRFMAGGEGNPLGARAMYLGNTLYRIHGTNEPSTIGTFVSSGCIRLTNEDVEDLYSRVSVGTRVVVLPGSGATSASASGSGSVSAAVSTQGPITR